MARPEMILFDYGGTLLREPGWDLLRGEEAVFRHVAYNPRRCTPEDLCAWEKNYFQSLQMVRDAGAELTEIQLLRLKYESHGIRLDISYEEAEWILWEHTAPITEACVCPHIREVLGVLREKGIRTGVISNIGWTGAALSRRIHTLLPGHAFECILASSDYGIRKPDGRLFQVALVRAELRPEQVWFCGNTWDKDIEGARAAGMKAVFYQGPGEGRGGNVPQFPEDRGILVISDWLELPDRLEEADSPAGRLRKENTET